MSIINGTNGDDILTGGSGNDTISGGNGNDLISGGAGNDTLNGGNGNDTLRGEAGNDTLSGGNGNDSLLGGTDNDVLDGGNGNDSLDGGTGSDTVRGGNGDDVLTYTQFEDVGSADVYEGGNGHDTLRLTVSQTLYDSTAFRAELTQFQAKLAHGSASFTFTTMGLQVTSIEQLELTVVTTNHAPTDIALSNASVAENSANDTVVGTLSADDPDAGETFTFSLVDNAGGLFAISGNNIVVAAALDFEAATTHEVTVRVTDSAGNTFDKAFTVNLSNVSGNFVGDNNANTLLGTSEEDTIQGLGGADSLQGFAGNDLLDGGLGNDRAFYTDATGSITVNLAAGIVSGSGVGTDTLQSVEFVSGSNFADTFNAIGFSGTSANAGSIGASNEFEGRGGNDTIIGNGNTRISYANAAAGVIVDIQAGTATGDSSVGTDTFTGVTAARGSAFDDALFGSNRTTGPNVEQFEGRAGNDFIDGRGGFDRAAYDIGTTGGITVNLAAGTVTGDASIGTDTLRSIESIRGTNSVDSYDATGFTTSSTNAGSAGVNNAGAAFNEFEGLGGNDTIIGNGNTRIVFFSATAGVNVDLAAGTASGDASVGSDTFTGVNGVFGSNFDDTIIGDANQNSFEGRAGDDYLDGGASFDSANYFNSPNGVVVNLSTGTAADGWGGTDTLVNFEFISGSAFADTIIGSANGNENFEGRGGNDLIDGGGHINGSPFGDVVQYINSATSGVVVHLAAGTATDGLGGIDTLINIDSVVASQFDDTIIGNANDNALRGIGGNDTIYGGGGNDRIEGDQFVTQSFLGNDNLYGEAGQDTIFGNAGDDRLNGGADNDFLIGGTGADTFVYTTTADGLDHISDFDGHSGQTDVIEFDHVAFGDGLAAGGQNTGTLDASHFVADNTGPTDAAQVFWYNTDDHTLYYDADGNGAGSAIAIAVLDNGFVLNHTDLVLV